MSGRGPSIRSSMARFEAADWFALVGIVAASALVRIAFFTGFFGSDEVTYVQAAIAASHVEWQNATYIGSLRLGINYPIAAAIALFGPSEAAASLWGFLCSVLEVAAVYWFGKRLGGRAVAVAASVMMAFLPLHVHLAGRVMADPPLALFITLTFVGIYEAEQRNSTILYVLAGACAGFVFWIKEAAIIFVAVFALWALIRQRGSRGWLWASAGMCAVIAANFASMWALSGDPFYMLHAMKKSVEMNSDMLSKANATYYLTYLFVAIGHSWLVGYLAIAGVAVAFFAGGKEPGAALATRYLLVWAFGLVILFSLFVVSLSPLRLIPKQTNYMTIFFAPLCLLGGVAFAQLRSRLARGLGLGIYVVGAVFLCALEQQTIRTFTANSRAALRYAAENPSRTIYVVTNAYRLNTWAGILSGAGELPVQNLRSMSDLVGASAQPSVGKIPNPQPGDVLAIVDNETLNWGDNGLRSVRDIPSCWQKVATLSPPADTSLGRILTLAAARLVDFGPRAIAAPISAKLASLLTPRPADVYAVPPTCE